MSRRHEAKTDHGKPCPRCFRETSDGLLCDACAWGVQQGLSIIVNWWPDLFDTLTRQDRKTARTEGRRIGHETPLPFDVQASELANTVRHVLVAWVRLTVDEMGATYPADRISTMVEHLRGWTNRLRKHEAAVEYADEIAALAGRVVRVIDTADGQLVHVPHARCITIACRGELVANVKRDWFAESFVRCRTCGRTWSAADWAGVRERSEQLDDEEDAALSKLGDSPGEVGWVTAQRISEALDLAVPTIYNAATKCRWRRRKVGRHVLYAVDDVQAWRSA